MVLGVYEQQLAVQLDARAYRIAVAWLDLGRVVDEVEWQRYVAFDRASLAGGVTAGASISETSCSSTLRVAAGGRGTALQVEDFAIQAGLVGRCGWNRLLARMRNTA